MFVILGSLVVIASVIGGFLMSHGNLAALWQPNELVVIGGAAVGAFIISNPGKIIRAVAGGIPGLLRKSKYSKETYLALLAMLFQLFTKMRRDGMLAIEMDIEDPDKSELFRQYPVILADHHAMTFIIDYLRLMISGSMDAMQVESLMDLELETHHQESSRPSAALSKISDALPGFGIVAAVLGVVITMSYIGGEPAELGHHVAAALVGTFLGILLAYGFVGPVSIALEHQASDQSKFLECIKVCMLAILNGYNPAVAIEYGRKVLYSTERPSFRELDDYIKSAKQAAA